MQSCPSDAPSSFVGKTFADLTAFFSIILSFPSLSGISVNTKQCVYQCRSAHAAYKGAVLRQRVVKMANVQMQRSMNATTVTKTIIDQEQSLETVQTMLHSGVSRGLLQRGSTG